MSTLLILKQTKSFEVVAPADGVDWAIFLKREPETILSMKVTGYF